MNGDSILIYGRDPSLLQTRRWILEAQGYPTLTATSLSDFASIPRYPGIGLLVLCHSLDEDTCTEALDLAELLWPGVKSLVLATGVIKPCIALSGEPVVSLDGPLKLVSTVKNLVGSAPAFSDCQLY